MAPSSMIRGPETNNENKYVEFTQYNQGRSLSQYIHLIEKLKSLIPEAPKGT